MKNETGKTYNRLTVISRSDTANSRRIYWLCKCSCGQTTVVAGDKLRSGHTKSCGCLINENVSKANKTHGKSETQTYKIWIGMRSRCIHTWNSKYKDYGGRGINVCTRWLKSFENFLKDMGERPDGMTLDRKNNEGDYKPSNCRWASNKQQSRNKRSTKLISFKGETKSLADWCEGLKLPYMATWQKLYRQNKPVKEVFS